MRRLEVPEVKETESLGRAVGVRRYVYIYIYYFGMPDEGKRKRETKKGKNHRYSLADQIRARYLGTYR